MKKLALILACAVMSPLLAQRQKLQPPPISFHFDAGYGLGLPAHQIVIGNSTQAIRAAGGLQIGLAAGVGVKNGFRFLVHAHYQRSGSAETVYENTGNDELVDRFYFQTFSLSPLIHYRIDLPESSSPWNPYLTFGPSMYVQGSRSTSTEYYDGFLQSEYEIDAELHYGISFGGRFTIGFERPLSEALYLTCAAQFRAGYLAYDRSVVTRVVEDGVDITDQFTVSELEVEYRRELDPSYSPRPSEASQSLYQTRGYMGFDINLGLVYYLW